MAARSVDDPMSQYQLLSGKTVLVIGASYMTTDRRFIWKTFQDLKAKVRFCNSCETHVNARICKLISIHNDGVVFVCFCVQFIDIISHFISFYFIIFLHE
jgi:uncharacterized circularly permuted ATP-grasp superfamily protein